MYGRAWVSEERLMELAGPKLFIQTPHQLRQDLSEFFEHDMVRKTPSTTARESAIVARNMGNHWSTRA